MTLLPIHTSSAAAACLYAGLVHTLRVLYLDASSAKYGDTPDKKQMLDQLCQSVAKASPEACIQMLQVGNSLSILLDLHTQQNTRGLQAGVLTALHLCL